jgi:sarcosine oxidase delta subunit
MSILLHCPNCGSRELAEFRYGGQIISGPGSNLPGLHEERWYHRHGCRRWLAAQRDVTTNEVRRTWWLDEEAP